MPYQLSMVGNRPTMVITGNGESGFDSRLKSSTLDIGITVACQSPADSVSVGGRPFFARCPLPRHGYARVGLAVVSTFSHVCGEIPAGVGECQVVLGNSRVRRLVCMHFDALVYGGWHVKSNTFECSNQTDVD
ncbi:unnamed protein product [Schistocephalus solidus]|uniref:Uncharacterized protein n=1 Tax=Schistocephalus solidus TaxID=70667 RepID=A0A3P7C3D9_SCHSO|nr:unnamed protein product [Schistocephalus solidus]